jgi:membrane-anchored glycerophosphoryl diester phosphodiesterase (GDPDase)
MIPRWLFTITGLVAALPARAQESITLFSVQDVGSIVGLPSKNLKDVTVNVISWVLGMLALLAVVFIIYAGFVWMTAAGNEEKIERAKKIISSAVIGLVIVILAWAIVIFVAGTTSNVTRSVTP